MKHYVLSVDQGTTGTRAFIYEFDKEGETLYRMSCLAASAVFIKTYYPEKNWVEQVPEEIFDSVLFAVEHCIGKLYRGDTGVLPKDIEVLSIANQRETFILWDAEGKPLYPAVVWQCKRSIGICEEWIQKGWEGEIKKRTGLKIDPYFPASKVVHVLRQSSKARAALEKGGCYFGTVDSWLSYKLTGNHYCDHTNASRTMLYNLGTLEWDLELLKCYGLENLRLPQIRPSSDLYGYTDVLGRLPRPVKVCALVGDSQASGIAHTATQEGSLKGTLGTGASLLLNIGSQFPSMTDLKETLYTLSYKTKNEIQYAQESIVFSCGAAVDWMRSKLRLFKSFVEAEKICKMNQSNGIFVLPAYSGLGTPFWKMDAKGAIIGITLSSSAGQITRAGYEAIAFQLYAIIEYMRKHAWDSGSHSGKLSFDGGLTESVFLMEFLAHLLGEDIRVLASDNLSGKGAAILALQCLYPESRITKIQIESDVKEIIYRADPGKQASLRALYEEWLQYIYKVL